MRLSERVAAQSWARTYPKSFMDDLLALEADRDQAHEDWKEALARIRAAQVENAAAYDEVNRLQAEVERMKAVYEAAMRAKVHPNEALIAAVREARGDAER